MSGYQWRPGEPHPPTLSPAAERVKAAREDHHVVLDPVPACACGIRQFISEHIDETIAAAVINGL